MFCARLTGASADVVGAGSSTGAVDKSLRSLRRGIQGEES
jgi:hypothetical protein